MHEKCYICTMWPCKAIIVYSQLKEMARIRRKVSMRRGGECLMEDSKDFILEPFVLKTNLSMRTSPRILSLRCLFSYI